MNLKKIVAVTLLVAGIGLIGAGAYMSFLIEEQKTCGSYLAGAERKLNVAKAAAGTTGESAAKEDASIALMGAQSVCAYARQSRQNGMLMMLGGLVSIIASVALLKFSRRAVVAAGTFRGETP